MICCYMIYFYQSMTISYFNENVRIRILIYATNSQRKTIVCSQSSEILQHNVDLYCTFFICNIFRIQCRLISLHTKIKDRKNTQIYQLRLFILVTHNKCTSNNQKISCCCRNKAFVKYKRGFVIKKSIQSFRSSLMRFVSILCCCYLHFIFPKLVYLSTQ